MEYIYDGNEQVIGRLKGDCVYDKNHKAVGYICDPFLYDCNHNLIGYVQNGVIYNAMDMPVSYLTDWNVYNMKGEKMGGVHSTWIGLLAAGLLLTAAFGGFNCGPFGCF